MSNATIERTEALRAAVAEILLEMRFESRKLQKDVAQESGISTQAMTALEQGDTDFRLSYLQKLAACYGYEVEVHFVEADISEQAS